VTSGSVTWFAPGRANLMGEHTDYNDGLVLPFALAQGVTATATARADGLLVMRSKQMSSGGTNGVSSRTPRGMPDGSAIPGTSRTPAIISGMLPDDSVTAAVATLEPGSVQGWAAYPAGVAWALAQAGYPVPGASIDIDSDLAVGAGISSSAALECSVALALCELGGHEVGRRELAAIARRAENEFVGAPTGMIDQSAALLCLAGYAMLLDCGTRAIRQVPFRPGRDGVVALVIDTGVPHALSDGQYAVRRAECEEAARQLGVPSLGQIAPPYGEDADSRLHGLADPVLRKRARHVLTDCGRARAIADLLGDSAGRGGPAASVSGPAGTAHDLYQAIGDLLTEGHASLRDDFAVSWDQADVTVETALAAGAFGAKMIGAGFGGSVLALVAAEEVATVRSAIRAEFKLRTWDSPEFLDAVPSPAAHKLS
jgi:galactokinase